MPVYEYECTNCGNKIEVMQKFSDPPIEECQICHGKMKRLISPCTFHLKGTGWYVTDYGSKMKENRREEKSDRTKTKDSEKKSVSSSEA